MYATILVPVDGSAAAGRALDEAIRLARLLGSTLRILHVVESRAPTAASEYAPAEQLVEDWKIAGEAVVPAALERARSSGVAADGSVRRDAGLRVSEVILREAIDNAADLIVMGAHGRSGSAPAGVGGDAEFVVRRSPVPVLLVRNEPADLSAERP